MIIQLGNVRVARGYSAALQVSHNSLSEICGEGETLADAVGYLIHRLAHIELEWAQAEGGYRTKIVQDAIADLWRFDEHAVRAMPASTTQRLRCQTTKPSGRKGKRVGGTADRDRKRAGTGIRKNRPIGRKRFQESGRDPSTVQSSSVRVSASFASVAITGRHSP